MTRTRKKYYAVRNGRNGPHIYKSWNDCSQAVTGWPNSQFKGFSTLEEAQQWLGQIFPSDSNAFKSSEREPDINEFSEEYVYDQQFSTPESKAPSQSTPPTSSLHEPTEPFTEDFIPVPSSPDWNTDFQRPEVPPVVLSEEQNKIFSEVMRGQNVFFTGSAGTGKSVLLRQIIERLRNRSDDGLAVTASTGIAAVNIGGVTLHSWAGIGLGIGTLEYLRQKISGNRSVMKRWRRTETLIIDEISMIDGVLFDKLEQLGRSLRESTKPFGGIQLVLSGDFCQLPPVPGRDRRIPSFAFESNAWARCFSEKDDYGSVYRLTKVFRQSDQTFVNMLNALRKGKPDADITRRFVDLARPLVYDDGLGPCELFPLRDQVYEANNTRLRDLPGESRTFVSKDAGGYDAYHHRISNESATNLLNKYTLAPDVITLKVGAQVMCIKNLSQGRMVNGSMGQITEFKSLQEARESTFSVATLDFKEPRENVVDKLIDEFGSTSMWPFVRFLNGGSMLLAPVRFEVMNVLGGVEASRHQVPLILAWALSIHKSQGQTLERVKVDLDRIFENGQAYVALSRATCLEGLEVQNFHPHKIMAHPRVLTFYEELEGRGQQSQPEPFDEFDEFEFPDLGDEAIPQKDSENIDEFDNLPDDEAIQLYFLAISEESEGY